MRGFNKLTALKIARLSKPGRYGDGYGLWLQVSQSGTKSWLLRYMRNGQAREMGLGALHAVPLAVARTKAQEARGLLADDQDPIEARLANRLKARLNAAKQLTFKECAERYIAAHQGAWRNTKHAAQWKSSLETYAHPLLGSLSVAAIDTDLVKRVLEPIWATKTETASRVRGRIEAILDWAKVNGLRDGDNPARWRGNLKILFPEKSSVAKVRHHEAMPYHDIPSFMATLRGQAFISARALEFTVLTAARTNETIGAVWSEIDLRNRLWTIPAERMKAKKEHRVPLGSRALEILSALPQESKFLFPGARALKPLSNMAMLELLRGMKSGSATVHGFRSTFMDWGHDVKGYPKEIMDLALAHRIDDKVEAAYRRGTMLERRRDLMAAWDSFCAGKAVGSKVVRLRAAG